MDIKNIITVDTDGALSKEIYKVMPELPAVTAWFSDIDAEKRTLFMSPSNIRFTDLPNIQNSTYATFLTYNGSLGLSNKIFSAVVAQGTGLFDMNNAPVLEYNPGEVVPFDAETVDDIVVEISMYNGTVDVVTYSEGILVQGEKQYKVKSVRANPTNITKLPNIEGGRVYLDGWYSYTTVIFKNISVGDRVEEGIFYGYQGFIFKASVSGIMNVLTGENEGSVAIISATYSTGDDAAIQEENTDYKEILFSLDSSGTDDDANSGNTFIHSQILITEEIRDAIIKEVMEASLDTCCGPIEYEDWQKLTMKRMAAAIMFENSLFENAQIIIESSRSFCMSGKYDVGCY